MGFHGRSLVREGRISGNHEHVRDLGKGRNDLLGQSVAEIILIGVLAPIVKGQDCNGGLVNVLDLLFAKILVAKGKSFANLVKGGP